MASSPAFANVPRIGVGAVTVANTNRDGTGTLVDVITAVAAGTRVERLVVKATGDPADSVVTIFYFDGTATFLFDEFDIGDPAAPTTTLASYREERVYVDLVLPANSKIRAAVTVAPTTGGLLVYALGADLT